MSDTPSQDELSNKHRQLKLAGYVSAADFERDLHCFFTPNNTQLPMTSYENAVAMAWQHKEDTEFLESYKAERQALQETIQQRNGLIEALSQRNAALVAALAEINQFCREDIERGNESSGLRLLTLAAINRALSETKENGNG